MVLQSYPDLTFLFDSRHEPGSREGDPGPHTENELNTENQRNPSAIHVKEIQRGNTNFFLEQQPRC